MNIRLLKIPALLFLLSLPLGLMAQSVSLNNPALNEYLRRQQLLDHLDGNFSFNIRPIHPDAAFDTPTGVDLDGTFSEAGRKNAIYKEKKRKSEFRVLPLLLNSQYTSAYAFGTNDGPMVPNRGMQHLLSAGFYYRYGKFSLQLQPEILLAQNKDYRGFPIEHNSTILYYYEYLNRIDMPEQFGSGSYNRAFAGQSSIRYTTGAISLGLSTENLWWGPGKRNSLLMSNNAPGFLHFSLNTVKPISTAIGHFEGQLVAGHLHGSGFLPPHADHVFQKNPVHIPKREDDRRYLSGLIISYQPKWVPGLSFGFSSVNHMYRSDMNTFEHYLPVFNSQKSWPNGVQNREMEKRNQMSSGFFRWMSQEGHFEFYGEYGTNGNSRKFRDWIVEPELNRAFTFGFSNYFPLKRENEFFQISSEMTQTGQTVWDNIVNVNSWYIHDHVRHGYTHNGQVLGAGNGPGSNVIFVEASWVKDFNRIGLQFERIVYNNDFYYFRFEEVKDWRRKYVDLVPSLVVDWRFDNLLVSGRFQHVNTLNYKWYLENHPTEYFIPGLDRKNFVANISLQYILP